MLKELGLNVDLVVSISACLVWCVGGVVGVVKCGGWFGWGMNKVEGMQRRRHYKGVGA